MKGKLIPVLPKNYRQIALHAISVAAAPVVLVDGRRVDDFSAAGPLTQKGIGSCRNFEIRDGTDPILGFHDHPREMWISEPFVTVAQHGAQEGWLQIQGPAS